MLKRINWKAIFKGFAWLVCLAGVVVLMSFIGIKKRGKMYQGRDIDTWSR